MSNSIGLDLTFTDDPQNSPHYWPHKIHKEALKNGREQSHKTEAVAGHAEQLFIPLYSKIMTDLIRFTARENSQINVGLSTTPEEGSSLASVINTAGEETEEPIALQNIEAFDEPSVHVHRLQRALTRAGGTDRLESLTRVLSSRTNRDAKIEINPDDFDLRALLQGIVQRLDEEGFQLNFTGVSFRNLTAKGVDASASYAPSLFELVRSIVRLPAAAKRLCAPPLRDIIRNVDGLIEPGEMLLVLGRPGSGCTTLLRTLAGEIDQFRGVEGELLYDGVSQKDMLKNFKNQIIYNPECEWIRVITFVCD
jgi:ABC-type multidrug transport system fused ATPase/permease subunit